MTIATVFLMTLGLGQPSELLFKMDNQVSCICICHYNKTNFVIAGDHGGNIILIRNAFTKQQRQAMYVNYKAKNPIRSFSVNDRFVYFVCESDEVMKLDLENNKVSVLFQYSNATMTSVLSENGAIYAGTRGGRLLKYCLTKTSYDTIYMGNDTILKIARHKQAMFVGRQHSTEVLDILKEARLIRRFDYSLLGINSESGCMALTDTLTNKVILVPNPSDGVLLSQQMPARTIAFGDLNMVSKHVVTVDRDGVCTLLLFTDRGMQQIASIYLKCDCYAADCWNERYLATGSSSGQIRLHCLNWSNQERHEKR